MTHPIHFPPPHMPHLIFRDHHSTDHLTACAVRQEPAAGKIPRFPQCPPHQHHLPVLVTAPGGYKPTACVWQGVFSNMRTKAGRDVEMSGFASDSKKLSEGSSPHPSAMFQNWSNYSTAVHCAISKLGKHNHGVMLPGLLCCSEHQLHTPVCK